MRRTGLQRTWLRWALGISVAAAACVAVMVLVYRSLPDLVPEDRLRGALATHAANWSGGELHLPADVEVSLGRGPMLTVKDAEIRGRIGGAEWQLGVATLHAAFRIRSLLQGRVEIESLTLAGPQFRFRDRDGPSGPGLYEMQASEPEHPAPVGEVIITDASIAYEDATGRRLVISGIDLRMAADADSVAVLLTGALPAGEGRVHVQGRLDDPAATFSGSGGEVRLALRGAATAEDAGTPPPPPTPDVPVAAEEGEVVSALRRFAAAVGLTGLGPLSLEGRLAVTPRSLVLADATMSASGVVAEGDLTVALGGEEAPFEQWGRVVGGAAAAWRDGTAAIEAGAWRKAPVSLAWLAPLEVVLAARLSDGRLAGTALEARRVRFDASGGRARLDVAADGDLGRLRGELALGTVPGSDSAQVAVKGRLEDVVLGETGRVLLALAPPPLVAPPRLPEGTLDAKFDVVTEGETLGGMLTALDGSLGVEVRDGSITGADLTLTLESLAEGREFMTEEDGPLIPAAGRTEFDTVAAHVNFVQGAARLAELRIRGERYSIDMSGEADLQIGAVRAEGQATLREDGSDAGGSPPLVDLPLGFGGTLAAPVVAAGVPRRENEVAPVDSDDE